MKISRLPPLSLWMVNRSTGTGEKYNYYFWFRIITNHELRYRPIYAGRGG